MTAIKSYPALFSSRNNVSLKQFTYFKKNMLNNQEFREQGKKIIKFSFEKMKQELQKIQWRSKTEFPIVKVLEYKLLNSKSVGKQKIFLRKILLQLKLEQIVYTLADIDEVPIFKVIYLLKQTIVASQRLCGLYGNFILRQNMIAINTDRRCKIWHNSKFHVNSPQFSCKNQLQSVRSIVQLFTAKTKISPKSIKFYQQLQRCKTFCDCLKVVQNMKRNSKITIPSSFTINDQFSSSICSPRKYVSRPPSNEKNPEESEHNLIQNLSKEKKKNKSETFAFKENKRANFHWKQCSLRFLKKNKNQLAQIKQKQNQNLLYKQFPSYLKRGRSIISQTKKISPINNSSSNNLSPSKKKHQLMVIESICQGDSGNDSSIHQCLTKPKNQQIEIPQMSKDDIDCSISSLLVDNRSEQSENNATFNALNKNLQSTLDSLTFVNKKQRIKSVFDPAIKSIQKSFDEVFTKRQ